MSDGTGIEWTDATWNPVTGCTKVSPGCDHCYAETFAERWRGTPGHYFEGGFDAQLRPDKLGMPLRWKRPRRIFVNSMSDLFHDAIPDEYIARVFAVMALTRRHTFQVLTKRHGRMRSLLNDLDFRQQVAEESSDTMGREPSHLQRIEVNGVNDGWHVIGHDDLSANVWAPSWPLPNVWLGVSAEDQKWADIRIPALLETPAAVRWVSAEPLLGPIDLSYVGESPALVRQRRSALTAPCAVCGGWGKGPVGVARHCPDDYHFVNKGGVEATLDWVVAGGESGPGARPMDPDWARSIRDQCATAGVPFLFKQWGGVRKKEAGRELDGRTWDDYPATA